MSSGELQPKVATASGKTFTFFNLSFHFHSLKPEIKLIQIKLSISPSTPLSLSNKKSLAFDVEILATVATKMPQTEFLEAKKGTF